MRGMGQFLGGMVCGARESVPEVNQLQFSHLSFSSIAGARKRAAWRAIAYFFTTMVV